MTDWHLWQYCLTIILSVVEQDLVETASRLLHASSCVAMKAGIIVAWNSESKYDTAVLVADGSSWINSRFLPLTVRYIYRALESFIGQLSYATNVRKTKRLTAIVDQMRSVRSTEHVGRNESSITVGKLSEVQDKSCNTKVPCLVYRAGVGLLVEKPIDQMIPIWDGSSLSITIPWPGMALVSINCTNLSAAAAAPVIYQHW